MSARIRVLVVDSGPRLVSDLRAALPRGGLVVVTGPVHGADEAIDALERQLVDLVVVCMDRVRGGAEVIAEIAAGSGRGRVLAVSEHDIPETSADALFAGASGVLASVRAPYLTDIFRRALAGELVLPADDLSRIVDRITTPAEAAGRGAFVMSTLTPREREILRLLAAGASTADVAEAFGISPLTVQSHVKNILSKLGVHSKVEAVRLAWRHGLATTPV